jgi:hypothetical protein
MAASAARSTEGHVAEVSKEVRGTITQLGLLRMDKFEVTVTFTVDSLENLRVGKNLIVTLPEGKQ